ncbi:hypothetical protein LOAG_08292 [Loa loa]|uniref:Uncharacterized protein n=1 Tax=Loa loa TaxID=7209 RepID=A0A1S0TTW5_LOALO|nr:hypothetical protein LOAG_08292 [Loa loa]EFO20199.2 hypothetical protein LOAG_08292 [Loa loa]
MTLGGSIPKKEETPKCRPFSYSTKKLTVRPWFCHRRWPVSENQSSEISCDFQF